MLVALIIPAYNEALTISSVIEEFNRHLPDALFVVVDNNSTDGTETLARDTFRKLQIPGVILRERRQGKSFAIERAFRRIDADVYLMVDADMTYPASRAADLIGPILDGTAEMVVGDRHYLGGYRLENKRRFHNFGNALIKVLVGALFWSNLNDILSGYRAFSRQFVKTFPILGQGFTLEAEMTLHALDKNLPIVEVPIEYKDRPEGSVSKLNTIRDGISVVRLIFEILRTYRPFAFFGTLSCLLFLGGIGAGFPVIREFIFTGYISHVPLAILSTGLMVVSLVMFAIGIILDTVATHNRFSFYLRFLEQQSDVDIRGRGKPVMKAVV